MFINESHTQGISNVYITREEFQATEVATQENQMRNQQVQVIYTLDIKNSQACVKILRFINVGL